MFKNPFSFEGRIKRTEYGISFIIYVIIAVIVNAIIQNGNSVLFGLAYIPMLWFFCAQGAKRCHDMGTSGWYQIIPFYILWMLYPDSDSKENNYGDKPKQEMKQEAQYLNTIPDYNPNEIYSEKTIEKTNEPKEELKQEVHKQNTIPDFNPNKIDSEETVEKANEPVSKIDSEMYQIHQNTPPEFNTDEINSVDKVEDKPENTNDRFMPQQNSDLVEEQTIENEVVNKTFVPKKKPIRKS